VGYPLDLRYVGAGQPKFGEPTGPALTFNPIEWARSQPASVPEDSYDEQAHLGLVTVLFKAGRLGQAHRHYQIYASRRMRENGVPPHQLSEMQLSATAPRRRANR
jgi:hypothetical protein